MKDPGCYSQRVQPSQQVVVSSPARESLRLGDRLCFGEDRPLGFEIDRGVLLGGIEALVPHPMGDGAKVDAGFEQIDGSAVANTMRVDALAPEGGQER